MLSLPSHLSVPQVNIVNGYHALPGGGTIQVNAKAGSGKTYTMMQVLEHAVPEREYTSTLCCAFSKEIEGALVKRVPAGVTVKTMHSIGFKTLRTHLAITQRATGKFANMNNYKYKDLLALYIEQHPLTNLTDLEVAAVTRSIEDLIHFVRVTLTDFNDIEAMAATAREVEVDVPIPDYCYPAVTTILKQGLNGLDRAVRGRTYAPIEMIDYDDMLWLPYMYKAQPEQYKHVLVDECQDLSAAQSYLAFASCKPGGKKMFVGDPNQAIYAFCGADSRSYDKIGELSNAVQMPLSICYRCSREVIALAQQVVPQIEASPTAIQGTVKCIEDMRFLAEVKAGDMVLSRTNAPLMEYAYQLIREKKRVKVRGRDIMASILKTVKAISLMVGFDFSQFPEFVEEYRSAVIGKLMQNPEKNEKQIIAVHDRVDCIIAVYEGTIELNCPIESYNDFVEELKGLFDDTDGKGVILLSSVHRAKGLEAETVYLLRPDQMPHPMAKTDAAKEQEQNLRYVAYTRAMDSLFIVNPKGKQCLSIPI